MLLLALQFPWDLFGTVAEVLMIFKPRLFRPQNWTMSSVLPSFLKIG